MARFINQNASDIGLSPFELRFKGQKRTDKTLIRLMHFDADSLVEETLGSVDETAAYKAMPGTTWINVDGLHDEKIIGRFGEIFNLDRMVTSDILNTSIRPKVVEYDDCLYVSIKMLRYQEDKNIVRVENISFVAGENFLLSFQESRGDVFDPVRIRIRNHKKKIRQSGSDYLLFAMLDIVIDNYIYILSVIGEKVEAMEELVQEPEPTALDTINRYKREINYLRKNVLPAREMINTLAKLDSDFLNPDVVGIHLKELQDNIAHAVETSDSYREILSDQLNIYHTTLSSKLNDILKFLTIFSVVFIPLTFIAGIYGTNFDNIPELHYKYSYHIMLVVMVLLSAGMLYYFRKRRWM